MAIQVRLLGRFQLQNAAGKAIALPAKKGQALLAVLALAKGAPVPRDHLLALLWGERGEAQARGSLRQSLAGLRKTLAEEADALLSSDDETISLRTDRCKIDAVDFDQLAESADLPDLEKADGLYQGDFLEGLQVRETGFEDWLESERRRLRRLYSTLLTKLSDSYEARGEISKAVAAAERWATTDPLNEAAHRALMRGHTRSGERSRAIGQYELCREFLQRDLGVVPDATTETLYQEILAGSKLANEDSLAGATKTQEKQLRLAVFPFENLSGDSQQDYFATGITQDILTELSRFSTLAIVPIAAGFEAVGPRADVVAVSRQMQTRYAISGSVQKTGRHFRITVQITDVDSGQQIWGNRFTGDLDDLFEVQDEIVRRISGNLYQPLMDDAVEKARRGPSQKADAYDFYLRANHFVERPTRGGCQDVRINCQKALEIDPGFALVYELLAWTYIHDAWNGWAEDPRQSLEQARDEVATGIALDSREGYLRGALGFAEVLLGNFSRGLAEMQLAIGYNPSTGVYHTLNAGALVYANQLDDAKRSLAKARQQSPGYHVIPLFQGEINFAEDQTSAAIPCFEEFLTMLPEFSYARLHLAACYVINGDIAAAQHCVARVIEESPNLTQPYLGKLVRHRDPVVVERLLESLDRAGLPGQA